MRTVEEIKLAIDSINKKVTESKLRMIRYSARNDRHMVSIESHKIDQYAGHVSALKWVLNESV